VQALGPQLASDATGGAGAVRAASDSLEGQFMALEQKIIDLRLTGRGQDEVRYPVRVGGQLSYVAGGIAASDFAPTTQQREVQTILARQVKENRAELDRLINQELPKLNAMLRSRGLRPIEPGTRGVAAL